MMEMEISEKVFRPNVQILDGCSVAEKVFGLCLMCVNKKVSIIFLANWPNKFCAPPPWSIAQARGPQSLPLQIR